ncbi:hypothetical protein [Dyella humicola]|uniref:hypothetical protein n=1 Tax=Dyella humicola TaxID=2992126 RepID=UPI00225A626D|nr:hypothetical protein [Dyella humicola]
MAAKALEIQLLLFDYKIAIMLALATQIPFAPTWLSVVPGKTILDHLVGTFFSSISMMVGCAIATRYGGATTEMLPASSMSTNPWLPRSLIARPDQGEPCWRKLKWHGAFSDPIRLAHESRAVQTLQGRF